ncbi:MAG: methyl-accepting chemotaxis protein [Clostridia bacterium]|nr:methyl-accepting chemotaxis protein [Clostridia bacterium]
MSIKKKMVGIFMLIIIIPFFVYMAMAYRTTYGFIKTGIEEEALQLVEEKSKGVESYFDTFKKGLTFLAKTNTMSEAVKDFEKAGVRGYIKNIEEASFRTVNQKNVAGLFKKFYDSYKIATCIYLGDYRDNFILVPYTKLDEGYKATGRDWYKEVETKRLPICTAPYIDDTEDVDKVVMTIAVPLIREDKFLGVIAADIELEEFLKTVNSSKIGESGYVYILDDENIISAHNNMDLIGKLVPVSKIEEEMLKGKESGTFTYVYKGVEKKESYKRLSNGWTVHATIPVHEIDGQITDFVLNFIFAGMIILVLSVIVSWNYSNGFVKEINKLIAGVEKLKAGDLTTKVDINTNDELGKLASGFNSMAVVMKGLLNSINDSAVKMFDSSSNLSDSSSELSKKTEDVSKSTENIASGATEQAEQVQDMASKISDLSSSIGIVSESMESIKDNSNSTLDLSNDGIEVVKSLNTNFEDTRNIVNDIGEVIDDLGKKSLDIEKIIETITQISEQTNLLALNASIEAARAGEHGKGFAVVADEIRKLAEQTASATQEIEKIIQDIQSSTGSAVNIMDNSKETMAEGGKSVINMEESFGKINNSITSVAEQILRVNGEIESINSNKDVLISSVENISSISEEFAASSEEVTAMTETQVEEVGKVVSEVEELKNLGNNLKEIVKRFKI